MEIIGAPTKMPDKVKTLGFLENFKSPFYRNIDIIKTPETACLPSFVGKLLAHDQAHTLAAQKGTALPSNSALIIRQRGADLG